MSMRPLSIKYFHFMQTVCRKIIGAPRYYHFYWLCCTALGAMGIGAQVAECIRVNKLIIIGYWNVGHWTKIGAFTRVAKLTMKRFNYEENIFRFLSPFLYKEFAVLFNYLPKEAAVIINLHHLDWMGVIWFDRILSSSSSTPKKCNNLHMLCSGT